MGIWHLQSAISVFRRRFSILFGVLLLGGTRSVLAAETTLYVNEYFEVRDHEQPVKYVICSPFSGAGFRSSSGYWSLQARGQR